jgi:ribosomal protein S18 acetylase RimI-like enzyme
MQHAVSRRTQVIIGHIIPRNNQADAFRLQSTSTDLVQPTVLPNEIKTQNHDFTTLQDDFTFRPYVSGKDDAAFKALDYICYQGEKTKLISEFVLKHPWETVQPRGSSLVAEDYKGDVAGVARSYIYDCNVNGEASSTSYVFLIRVHPDYRRMSLAIYLTARLFYRDVTEADVQYMTSWVVVDNTASLGLQDRIASVGKEVYGMPESEIIGAYRCLGCPLTEFTSKFSAPLNNSTIFRQVTSSQVATSLVAPHYADSQFFPHDLQALFASPLSLGVFTISAKNPTTGEEEVMASISAWNSGEVRISSFRDSDFRSDGAILLYNPWFHPSPEGREFFKQLVGQTCLTMSDKGFRFVNFFLPNDLNSEVQKQYLPVIEKIEKLAKMNVTWRARVWYVRNKTRLNMNKFSNIFYDPRQTLI